MLKLRCRLGVKIAPSTSLFLVVVIVLGAYFGMID